MRVRSRWSLAVVACVLGVGGFSSAQAVDWQLVSESSDGLRLRIEVRVPPPLRADTEIDGVRFSRFDIPTARTAGSEGAPERAEVTQWIALPPGGRATLRILESDVRDMGQVRLAPRPLQRVRYPEGASPEDPSSGLPLEEWVYDRALYTADGAHTQAARLGEVAFLRHQQVVPLVVSPLLYDPATEQLRIVRRLVVEVTLGGGPRAAASGDALRALSVTPQSWERIYAHTVLNGESARRWLVAPPRRERLGLPLKSGLLRPGLLGEDEYKLRVRRTGPTRVTASRLLGAGFPDGTPLDRLRLVLKRFNPAAPLDPTIVEIPIHVEDADSDGLFRSGDAFVFVAEHPRDDTTAGERAARYSFDNVYWLSVADTGMPARMPVRAPLGGTTPAPTRFDQEVIVEEDNAINLWIYCDDGELYFTLDRSTTEATKTVALPGRAADSDLDICIETQQDWLQRPFRLFVEFQSGTRVFVASNPGIPPNTPRGVCPRRLDACGTVPAAQVEPGDIKIVVVPEAFPDPFTDTTPYVDLIRLEYAAEYRATGDAIRFTSAGATGPTAFTIAGFSGAPLVALDVSDRKSPSWFDVSGALSGGTLTLTDDVPSSTLRRYEVLASAAIPTLDAANIELDVPDPILDDLAMLPLGSFDVLVVAHDNFARDAALLEWKAMREAMGHRVRIVATSDVYDAFNGGLLHYDPIYNLVRTAYDNWGIGFVMLVGDGSEDAAQVRAESGTNYVPAPVKYFPVTASSGGGNEYRNDLHDRYYAKMTPDGIPDLLIGRLPVGNTQELRNVVDKTALYENPLPDDDSEWRKRVVLFSDDEWVRRFLSDGSGIGHIRSCVEWNFFFSIRRTCEIVDQAFPGDLKCVPFYLHEFSNMLADRGVPEHVEWPIDSLVANCNSSAYLAEHRGGFTETVFYIDVGEALADSIGAGALFFALQSHANRAVVADEQIITRGLPFKPLFHNDGKPFVFFGLGCHLNEFGVVGEGETGGDAIGELYVTVPSNAAVASYASAGFEFLRENNRFHENMWRAIFNKLYFNTLGGARVNPDTIEANWRLSALTQISEITHGNQDIIDRYVLLGDPLLRLDAGVPRFIVADPVNGTIFEDGRIRPDDPNLPVEFTVTVNDEQGIDSLWVEKRFETGGVEPISNVFITANIDTAAQIEHKRSYTLQFSVLFDECNFDLHVGARDLAGRVSEWVGSAQFPNGGDFDQRLFANGVQVRSGDRLDGATAFRYEYEGCGPRPDLQLEVFLDGTPTEVGEIGADGAQVVWFADFVWDVPAGVHKLQFELDGTQPGILEADKVVFDVDLEVPGSLGLRDVLAFPNPFEGETRVFFNLDTQISGGSLRILDLNGRTVRHFDLGAPGVVQVLSGSPTVPGAIGSSQFMNYVEWDGTDSAGDSVANGVYLFELRIQDQAGRALRKRDKLVVMN